MKNVFKGLDIYNKCMLKQANRFAKFDKKKLRILLTDYKDCFTQNNLMAALIEADIDIENPNDNLVYKKIVLEHIFDQIELNDIDDEKILKFIRIVYLKYINDIANVNGRIYIPNDIKQKKIAERKKFIDTFNKILSAYGIRFNDTGDFTISEDCLIEYEEQLIEDILDKFGLGDIKAGLKKSKELLDESIINNDLINSTISAQQSGIAIEGALKYVYSEMFKSKYSETPSIDKQPNLSKAIGYYQMQLSKDIHFFSKDDALYLIIDAIRKEFRNISSHYTIDDIKSFSTEKIQVSHAILCLWTSKAAILCLLKQYEENSI